MKMTLQKITVGLSVFSLLSGSVSAAKTPSWKSEADAALVISVIGKGIQKAVDVEQFIRVFQDGLSAADRGYLLEQWKGKKFPSFSQQGTLFTAVHEGQTHTLEFVDPAKGRIKVNGKPFMIDANAPLKTQTEVLYKYLMSQKKSALWRAFVTEVHAAIHLPVIGVWALLVRLGVVGARIATSGATVEISKMVASASIGAYMFAGKGPIRIFFCKTGLDEKECVDEKGNPAKSDVVDQPGAPMNVEIGIEKCPDTSNGSFKMYTKALRTGKKIEHTAETETAGDKVRIKKITERHFNLRGNDPLPGPMIYTMDDKGLNLVEWTDIKDGKVEKRKLDRDFSKGNSADNTSENRDKWKGFEGIKKLVEETMGLYCKKDTKETVREPDGAARKATETN